MDDMPEVFSKFHTKHMGNVPALFGQKIYLSLDKC